MEAIGIQPDAPQVATSPQELLTLRKGEGFNLLDRYCYPVGSGILGAFGPFLANKILRRPPWAGIWQHIICGAVFYYIGDLVVQYKMKQKAEDFAVMKHYVSLHPDDFPPYERTQIKYLYMPWKPIR